MEVFTKIRSTREKRTERNFFLFISPWIIGTVWFTLFPMIISLVLSFTKCNMATIAKKGAEFIGFDNFIYIFSKDPVFLKSIGNTFYYSFLYVFLRVVVSLLLAVLFNINIKGKKLYRILVYTPALIPVVATSLVWKVILLADSSFVGNLFFELGLPNVDFLSIDLAMFTVVFINLIGSIGPTMIIFLAAIQGVPRELEEAAELDGAGAVTRFFKITIPIISSSIMFVSLTGFISALQSYANIALLTNGGPVYKTTTMAMQVVQNAFSSDVLGIGYACAEAWVVFMVIFVFTLIYFRMMRRQVYYGD